MNRKLILLLVALCTLLPRLQAQEENPFLVYDVPSQNLLKFNRFLINPTFSTVREDKSYINLLHRNQSVSFDNNDQMYFLSYSGRIGDRSGLGLSLYTQRLGTLSNYGVLANYAYGVKLSDKSNFTFGANLSYYNSGFDESQANPVEDDPFLSGFQDSSFLTFQPGFNISYGAFDFGMYAENLIDYNIKTSEPITSFAEKTFSGHLQYTHQFDTSSGIFEGGRLMPLARARRVGDDEFTLGGNLILDLPKIGWLQGGYDSFYGASAGIGFNLNRRISLGYTMEKGLTNAFDNFGLTHEISFAYSFTPNLTEDRVMLEEGYEESLATAQEEPGSLSEKDAEIAELKRRLAENDAILAELMFRQDSMEQNRQKDLEKRFEMVMRMVRAETDGERPDLEARARETYFVNNDKTVTDPSEAAIAKAASTEKPIGMSPPEQAEKKEVSPAPVEVRELPAYERRATEIAARNEAKEAGEKASDRTAISAVKKRDFRDLQDVQDGYYIVANVYKGEVYLQKFMEDLRSQGFEVDFIENPNNGLKYVYLSRFEDWDAAEQAVRSGFGGAYSGDLWVMNVDNRYTNEAYADNSRRLKEQADNYDTDQLRKNVVERDRVAARPGLGTQIQSNGSGSGFYIIANVFANPKNAARFIRYLNGLGLSASYFINPENNYRYVYLKRYDSWNGALISYYSNLNDTYEEKMWIMRVKPNLIA